MKRLLQVVSTATVAAGMFGSMAFADASTFSCGNISNTGPNSTNVIACVDVNKNNVVCNNQGKVVDINDQSATSGDATGSFNTSSGNVTTGNADNNNNNVVQLDASCTPAVTTTSTTPTAPSTPSTGSTGSVGKGGGGAASPASSAALTSAAALPDTGSNTAQVVAIVTAVVAVVALAGSQVAVRLYRRVSAL